MLGEPRGDEGAATAMDERAKDEWSPFAPAQRVVMAGCSFAMPTESHSCFTVSLTSALAVA